MEENDPYFFAFDQAYWYAKGISDSGQFIPITPESFALEYAKDCRLYHENKPNKYTCLKSYMDNYISELDCFEDIMSM